MERFLKKSSGEVYGPVSVDDLVYWATEGRVSPDDQVSDDRTHWQPAPALPELSMEWLITLPDGAPYGPIHLHALDEMVRDSLVDPSSTISHKDSGETFVLSEALCSSLIERNAGLQESLATLRAHVSEMRERDQTIAQASDKAVEAAATQEEMNRKLGELRARNQTLKDESKDFESRFLKEQKSAAQAAGEHGAEVQKLVAEIAKLREHGESSNRKLDQAKAEIEALREGLREAKLAVLPAAASDEETRTIQAALEQAQAEYKEERAQLRNQIKALELRQQQSSDVPESYRELATNADNLQREVAKWKKLYEEERDGTRKREETLQQRIEELRANESAARAQLEEVNRRLRHTQRSYDMVARAGEEAEGGRESVTAMQISVLMDSHNELSQSYDTLFTQLEAKAEELEGLMTERKEIESRAAERVQGMEATLKREQEEADRARRQLAEMQQSHFQLVKSYREMNDRFIRIRQELDRSAAPAPVPDKAAPQATTPAAPPAETPAETPAKKSRIRLNR